MSGLVHQGVVPMVCARCHGLYLAGKYLTPHFGPAVEALHAARPASGPEAEPLPCPLGCGEMSPRRIEGRTRSVIVDVCRTCKGAWFDGGEVQAIFEARRLERAAHLPELDAEGAARAELAAIQARQAHNEEVRGGGGIWLVQFVTGLPIETYNPVHRTPVVTWGLIAACVVAFALQLSVGLKESLAYAFVPAAFFRGEGGSGFVTSMFMHGGAGHLLGNMYFLKIFGDNVEDRLGRLRYLLMYVAFGLVATLAHAIANTDSEIPTLGASGAISGVLAAYAVYFPDSKVQVAPQLLTAYRRFPLRSLYYFPFWFAWQFIALLVFQTKGVAWWAHIGGFIAGFAGASLVRPEDPRVAAIAARMRQSKQ